MSNLSGKTIFLVKHKTTILLKTLSRNEAIETLNDFNFEVKAKNRAKLFKAIIK